MPNPQPYRTFADELAAMLDYLGITTAVVAVGHSFGTRNGSCEDDGRCSTPESCQGARHRRCSARAYDAALPAYWPSTHHRRGRGIGG